MSSSSADWTLYCSPIQDQGSCGSCTAFGTIGVWEAAVRILAGNSNLNLKLSERDLFFCSGGACETGNMMANIFTRAVNVGACLESCCPYGNAATGVDYPCGDGRCDGYWLGGVRLSGCTPLTSVPVMKAALQSGPLVTTMQVHQSFLNYVSGVYHNLGPSDPVVGGHCVGIVGYDDSKQAWLLRNSWGTGWGMEGYCWIAYGDSDVDLCMYQLTPNGPETTGKNPSIWQRIWFWLYNVTH